MSTAKTRKEAVRIANAIVALVERHDGPVTLARLDCEIPGFAQQAGPSWQFAHEHGGGEIVIWEGMTEAGYLALHEVMFGRRVAVELLSNPLPYFVADKFPECENWQPVLLLPVRAANMDTPRLLLHWPQDHRDNVIAIAAAEGKKGYKPLNPTLRGRAADRCTA
jgi:hypothetical protein